MATSRRRRLASQLADENQPCRFPPEASSFICCLREVEDSFSPPFPLDRGTGVPRHSWRTLRATEDPPNLAAASLLSWGRSRCPRFRGDGQSDSEAVPLSLLSRRKRRLRKGNFFFLGLPATSQPAALLRTIIPSSAFLTTESKGFPSLQQRRRALTSHPFEKGPLLVFETRPFALFPGVMLPGLLERMGWTFHFLSDGARRQGTTSRQSRFCCWTKRWRPGSSMRRRT